jgi:hypothetical protein
VEWQIPLNLTSSHCDQCQGDSSIPSDGQSMQSKPLTTFLLHLVVVKQYFSPP